MRDVNGRELHVGDWVKDICHADNHGVFEIKEIRRATGHELAVQVNAGDEWTPFPNVYNTAIGTTGRWLLKISPDADQFEHEQEREKVTIERLHAAADKVLARNK